VIFWRILPRTGEKQLQIFGGNAILIAYNKTHAIKTQNAIREHAKAGALRRSAAGCQ
jgi:hypothetical protein